MKKGRVLAEGTRPWKIGFQDFNRQFADNSLILKHFR